MAKSKYAPALFEVMNRQKNTGKLGVPKWWKGGQQEAEPAVVTDAPDAAQPAATDVPQGQQSQEVTAQQPAVSASPAVSNMRLVPAEDLHRDPGSEMAEDAEFSGRWPAMKIESGRIFVAMGPTHAAVLGGGVLVLVMVAFLLGRSLGGGATPGDGGLTTMLGTPNPSVLQEPAAKTDTPPTRASGKPDVSRQVPPVQAGAGSEDELKPGMHYVVVDTFAQDALPAAEHVQKWLASTHGIKTVLRQRRDSYWLVATQPFNSKAECDPFVQKIKGLGADCRKELIKAKLPAYGFASPMPFKAVE